MNEIQIFKNDLFGEVRTVVIDGEIWFVLADVCKTNDVSLTYPVKETLIWSMKADYTK